MDRNGDFALQSGFMTKQCLIALGVPVGTLISDSFGSETHLNWRAMHPGECLTGPDFSKLIARKILELLRSS